MNKLSALILSVILLLYFNSCAPSKRFAKEDDEKEIRYEQTSTGNKIRALISEEKKSFNFSFDNPVIIKIDNKTELNIKPKQIVEVHSDKSKLFLNFNSKKFYGKEFTIVSADSKKIISFKRKIYRGVIKIRTEDDALQIINELELDQYLKGVIPSEMPLGDGTNYNEALKAFTICARTYALTKINKSKNFDVFCDVRDQVYSGAARENNLINKIVNETKNMILTYDDKPAVIYYHSTCGGYTEDAENVFSKNHIPYLISVKDGSPANCSISPKFNWEFTFSNDDLIDKLFSAKLINTKNILIENLKVKSRFESGRINELEINYSQSGTNKKKSIFGNNIRSIIRNSNNGILYSSNFKVTQTDDKIIIEGKGYGHGVGLCQWGAIGLSKKGNNYKDILSHYFPDTRVEILND